MLLCLIRGFIVYAVVVVAVRIMGKRQIGQLQPTELVVTILLSEIAAEPVVDDNFPLISALAVILLLISLEVLVSFAALKIPRFRQLVQGNSVAVIENGKLNRKRMKDLRLSVDDLLEALRLKDVFDITDAEFVYVETNGDISVELKNGKKTVTAEQMKISEEETGIPHLIISDGKVIKENFSRCCLNEGKLEKLLKSRNLSAEDVMILTADKQKVNTIITKEKK
ncbi:MAG: DUF421 domain-containing protein [Clostridia bacterium]|nr:DUF421 domain-containing protein [Clostridia bacterium]